MGGSQPADADACCVSGVGQGLQGAPGHAWRYPNDLVCLAVCQLQMQVGVCRQRSSLPDSSASSVEAHGMDQFAGVLDLAYLVGLQLQGLYEVLQTAHTRGHTTSR